MQKIILAFVISAIMVGCASVDIHTVKLCERQPDMSSYPSGYIKSYVTGTMITAYIGQPMVWWQDAKVEVTQAQDAYIVFKDDFNLTGIYRNKLFREHVAVNGVKGDKRKVIGEAVIDGKIYYVINAVNGDARDDGKIYGLLIDSNGVLNTNIITDDDCERGFLARKSILFPSDALFLYVKENPEKNIKVVVRPGGMKRALIYGGVNNISINITYREYTPDNLLGQSFYQNIIYQTPADIIRFQDLKIKVHEVTNEKIVFTVLEDGVGMPTP